jgi:TolB-like protein/Flp pilus assembly protein TadD
VLYAFETFILDDERCELRQDSGAPVALEPQVFDLLSYLVRHRDRVVSKSEIVEMIWDGRAISDSALDSRLSAVRKALGDSGKEQRLIQTMTRRGLRFRGDVRETTDAGQPQRAADARPDAAGDRPALAVLPLQNLSDDPAQEYFVDGLTEDLIAALGSWCRFPVVSRHSSFFYKGRQVDALEAGRQLGARYIVEGSVRKSDSHVRITARLVDATTGLQLWTNRYDHELADVFAVQDEITTRIAAAVEPELDRSEQRRAVATRQTDAAAYDLVQRGNWHHNKFTATNCAQAQRLFASAIEIDPYYSRAYASMALSKFWASQMGWADDRRGSMESALEFSRKAIALDDKDARGFFHLAQGSLWLRRQDEALAAARQSVTLNPSLVQAHAVLGYALDAVGEFEEAIAVVTHSLRLRPHDQTLVRCLPAISIAHYQLGAFEAAEDVARRAVRMSANFWMAQQMLAASLGQLARGDEAAAVVADIRGREPDVPRTAYSGRFPFRERVHVDRLDDGLVKAGWLD